MRFDGVVRALAAIHWKPAPRRVRRWLGDRPRPAVWAVIACERFRSAEIGAKTRASPREGFFRSLLESIEGDDTMAAACGIVVVIPTLDEAALVGRAVSSALEPHAGRSMASSAQVGGPAGLDRVEVVVVDGGSRDETAVVARAAGARVIDSPRGRGRQLDAGWRATEGQAVLFLHADSVLPERWCEAVTDALKDRSVAGGAFRFGFSELGLTWRLLEWGVSLRVHLLRLPYGDQAIFVRRDVLERSGGVPHVEILEDLDLVRAIRRAGRLRLLPQTVRTSARRHRGRGVVRTIVNHALALAGFYIGLDRRWIAQKVRG